LDKKNRTANRIVAAVKISYFKKIGFLLKGEKKTENKKKNKKKTRKNRKKTFPQKN
jgi:hypothetical protein